MVPGDVSVHLQPADFDGAPAVSLPVPVGRDGTFRMENVFAAQRVGVIASEDGGPSESPSRG
jgi:hypothetical protein